MKKNKDEIGISPEAVLQQIGYKDFAAKLGKRQYDFVDFFCGAGGMSYGFHRMAELTGKLRWAGAVDIDKFAIDTYERNYGVRPAQLNLGEEDVSTIRKALDLREKNELVLIGCAPCQGFSSHRKKDHRGPDKRNSLVGRFAEIAVELKPRIERGTVLGMAKKSVTKSAVILRWNPAFSSFGQSHLSARLVKCLRCREGVSLLTVKGLV